MSDLKYGKYIIKISDYLDAEGETKGKELSDKMEELAADFISENGLSLKVDDLWNDGTAEEVRSIMLLTPESSFFVDDYFQELVDRVVS